MDVNFTFSKSICLFMHLILEKEVLKMTIFFTDVESDHKMDKKDGKRIG